MWFFPLLQSFLPSKYHHLKVVVPSPARFGGHFPWDFNNGARDSGVGPKFDPFVSSKIANTNCRKWLISEIRKPLGFLEKVLNFEAWGTSPCFHQVPNVWKKMPFQEESLKKLPSKVGNAHPKRPPKSEFMASQPTPGSPVIKEKHQGWKNNHG